MTPKREGEVHFDDPAFWRAGAISTIAVMSVVLIMLTIDTLAEISPGGSHVPPYMVINQHSDYKYDAARSLDVPVIGEAEPLFGKPLDEAAATALIDRGKMVIQSRASSIATPSSVTAPITPRTSLRLGSIPIGRRGRR
jgi:hypothetical protein